MKKLLISLVFLEMLLSPIHTYAQEQTNNVSNDDATQESVTRGVRIWDVRKSAELYDYTIYCWFKLSVNDVTGYLEGAHMYASRAQGGETYYSFDITLDSISRKDAYTLIARIKVVRTMMGDIVGTDWADIVLDSPGPGARKVEG